MIQLKNALLAGLIAYCTFMVTGCDVDTRLRLTIPNDYEGFLIIHYECPHGALIDLDDRIRHITFADNGIACIQNHPAALSSPSGIFSVERIATKDGKSVRFAGASMENINGYALIDLGVMMAPADSTESDLDIFWVGSMENLREISEAGSYQTHLWDFLEQTGLREKPWEQQK